MADKKTVKLAKKVLADDGFKRGGMSSEDVELQNRLKQLLHPEHEDPAAVEKYLKAKEAYFMPTHKRGAYSNRVLPMHAHEVETKIGPLGNATPKEAKEMSWHEFHKIGKGGTLFTLGGDRSNLGRLTHINGQKLAWPVDLHAGTKYMTEPNEGAVWANAKGAASALQSNIREAAKKGPVYGAFAPMGPTAVDSSVNMFDALMAQVPKSGISDKDAKEFDESLKNGAHIKGTDEKSNKKREIAKQIMESWPGIRNAKKALEFGKNISGEHRAAIVKHWESAPFQNAGFPSVGITRAAITDPEMLGVAGNMMGHHIVELHEGEYDPQNLSFEHSTYGVPTRGKLIGKVPLAERQVIMPDYTEQQIMHPSVMKTGEPTIIHPYSPNPQGRSSFRGNTEMRQGIQPINERMLESIEQAHGTSFAHGGEVEPVHIMHQHFGNPIFTGAVHKAGGGEVDQSQDGITAYHGSPHDFEQFDTSKIGTGEGNQSFGHGLYFAQAEPTAQAYKKQLAGKDAYLIDHIMHHAPELKHISQDEMNDIKRRAMDESLEPERAALWAQNGNRNLRSHDTNRLANVISSYRNAARGHMYEVRIKGHPDQFLHWDKPLTDQPENIQKVFKSFPRFQDNHVWNRSTLGEAYGELAGALSDKIKATQFLHSLGYKGLKYLDQGSRASTGNQTHNYVVFNDKDVDIKRKYAQGGEVEESKQEFAHGGDVEHRKHFEDGGDSGGGGGDSGGGGGGNGDSGGGGGPGDASGGDQGGDTGGTSDNGNEGDATNSDMADAPSENANDIGLSQSSVANAAFGAMAGLAGPVGTAIGVANSISDAFGGPSVGGVFGGSAATTGRDANTADATGVTGGNAGNGPSAADLGGSSTADTGGFGGFGSSGSDGSGGGGGDVVAPSNIAKPTTAAPITPAAPTPLTAQNIGVNTGYAPIGRATFSPAMPSSIYPTDFSNGLTMFNQGQIPSFADGGVVDAALKKVSQKYSSSGLPLNALQILSKISRLG